MRLWEVATGRERDRTAYAVAGRGGVVACAGSLMLFPAPDQILALRRLPER